MESGLQEVDGRDGSQEEKEEVKMADDKMEEVEKQEPAVEETQEGEAGKDLQPAADGEGNEKHMGGDAEEVKGRLRSMWEFAAAWKLLDLFARAGMNIPITMPDDLERFLVDSETYFGELEEIHARVLGLGPASFNRWINKTKAVARANALEFPFLYGEPSLTPTTGRRSSGGGPFAEEINDGLKLKDARSYLKLEPEVRCLTLHALLERQFTDLEGRLGEEVRSLDCEELRLMPFGYDAEMSTYWYFGDSSRLYREPDLDHQQRVAARRRKEQQVKEAAVKKLEKPRTRKRGRAVTTPVRPTRTSLRMATRRRTRASGPVDEEPIEEEKPLDEEVIDEGTLEVDQEEEPEPEVELEGAGDSDPPFDDSGSPDEDSQAKEDPDHEVPSTIAPCLGWELVANGYDDLIQFSTNLGLVRKSGGKALCTRIQNELAPEWEEVERRKKKELEKKEKAVWTHVHQKRSARIHALEQRRELERQEEVEQEKMDQKLEDVRQLRKMEIVQSEKERDRELRTLRRARSLAGVQPTAASSRPQRESSRRRSNYREDGLPNEAQLDAQFSVRNERISSELAVEDIEEYTHFYDGEIANRLLDRFRFLGPRGESSKLENLDLYPDAEISAEGVLIPPDWSDALPLMISISKVTDWCIDYGDDPSLWIRSSSGAWYRLDRPANDYRWAFGSTRKKFEICSRLFILANELGKEDLTWEYVTYLLAQQYYSMRANKEADIFEVAGFCLVQLEALDLPALRESTFVEKLRQYMASKPNRYVRAKTGPPAVSSQRHLAVSVTQTDKSDDDDSVTRKQEEESPTSSVHDTDAHASQNGNDDKRNSGLSREAADGRKREFGDQAASTHAEDGQKVALSAAADKVENDTRESTQEAKPSIQAQVVRKTEDSKPAVSRTEEISSASATAKVAPTAASRNQVQKPPVSEADLLPIEKGTRTASPKSPTLENVSVSKSNSFDHSFHHHRAQIEPKPQNQPSTASSQVGETAKNVGTEVESSAPPASSVNSGTTIHKETFRRDTMLNGDMDGQHHPATGKSLPDAKMNGTATTCTEAAKERFPQRIANVEGSGKTPAVAADTTGVPLVEATQTCKTHLSANSHEDGTPQSPPDHANTEPNTSQSSGAGTHAGLAKEMAKPGVSTVASDL